MSTYFKLSKTVSAADLFGGELEKFGVREHIAPATNETSRCLTDGRHYLWVYLTDDGLVSWLSSYFPNVPIKILDAIAEKFETEIFSEHEPQYWGFDTQEEWDTATKDIHDQQREQFYRDLCAFVRGLPNNIRPGTIGEIQAKIAKKLFEEDATIIGDRDKLLAAIDEIYGRDHAVVVTLGPEDLALARMLGTHEDDLPQA
jgi:hypothetical protein